MAGDPGTGNQNPTAAGGQGATFTLDDKFFASLPDELKAEPSVQLFKGKGINDVLTSHVNAQRMIGGDKVVIPAGKNDTPEAWEALYSKLGRPAKPDDYKLERPTPPDGLKYNEQGEKAFREFAHSIGLTPKQASGIYDLYNKTMIDSYAGNVEADRAFRAEAEKALRAEWGNKYDSNVNMAKRVLETFGGKPEAVTQFVEKFGDDPVAIRVLANLGSVIGEANFVKGTSAEYLAAPEKAMKAAHDIMTNKQNPLNEAYFNKQHIRHNEAVEEVERLYALAKGSEKVSRK